MRNIINRFRFIDIPYAAPLLILMISLTKDLHACGSMGLDQPHVWGSLLFIIFVPAIILIPVEIKILKDIGQLKNRAISAYVVLLVTAKLGAWIMVAASREIIRNIFIAEFIYSVTHFLISTAVLLILYRCPRSIKTALLISTVIPWIYSLSLALLGFLGAALILQ